jgi:hypothetical protein
MTLCTMTLRINDTQHSNFIVMLSVIMLSSIRLNVVMLNVVAAIQGIMLEDCFLSSLNQ